MQLFNITEVDKLFQTLDQCKGNVDLIMPDGATISWKEHAGKIKSLTKALPLKKLDGLELKLHNDHDFNGLLRYMLQAN